MSIDEAIAEVVGQDNCSGCGTCVLLDASLEMALDANGFLRPVRTRGGEPADRAEFDQVCPGRITRSRRPEHASRHPTMGPVVRAWAAWATDPETRFAGSSGGVLTALSTWLVESGDFLAVHATSAGPQPRRSVAIEITTRAQALAAAGSRYAPVAAAASAGNAAEAVSVKPCEATALRALADVRHQQAPLLMSFFCAGTPSQDATDEVLRRLGVPDTDELHEMRYRGRGWPGRFTAVQSSGVEVSTDYERSWGEVLGRNLQWRCKICPDGVGESADISAADYWAADEHGYPSFADGAGVSALIARTERGADIVARAIDAGVITAAPLDLDDLARVQPLQRERRRTLLARLVGVRAAGGKPPVYRGFRLLGLSLAHPRASLRAGRGAYRRRRG